MPLMTTPGMRPPPFVNSWKVRRHLLNVNEVRDICHIECHNKASKSLLTKLMCSIGENNLIIKPIVDGMHTKSKSMNGK